MSEVTQEQAALGEPKSIVWEATVIRACRFCGSANPNNEPLCPGCGQPGNTVERLGVISEWHKEEETDEG